MPLTYSDIGRLLLPVESVNALVELLAQIDGFEEELALISDIVHEYANRTTSIDIGKVLLGHIKDALNHLKQENRGAYGQLVIKFPEADEVLDC
jgi:hypothetical protein